MVIAAGVRRRSLFPQLFSAERSSILQESEKMESELACDRKGYVNQMISKVFKAECASPISCPRRVGIGFA